MYDYSFLLHTYEKMLHDAKDSTTRTAYKNIVDTLYRSYEEVKQEIGDDSPVTTEQEAIAVAHVRIIVEAWQESATKWYHYASTDYSKRESGLLLDIYGFFLYLSSPTIPELPYN